MENQLRIMHAIDAAITVNRARAAHVWHRKAEGWQGELADLNDEWCDLIHQHEQATGILFAPYRIGR